MKKIITTNILFFSLLTIFAMVFGCKLNTNIDPKLLIASSIPSSGDELYYLGSWKIIGKFKMGSVLLDESEADKLVGSSLSLTAGQFLSRNLNGSFFQSFKNPKFVAQKIKTSDISPADKATNLRQGTSIWWGIDPGRMFYEEITVKNAESTYEVHFERFRQKYLLYYSGGWFFVLEKE